MFRDFNIALRNLPQHHWLSPAVVITPTPAIASGFPYLDAIILSIRSLFCAVNELGGAVSVSNCQAT